jgi:5-methyltetrahydrofolate--homocysteine methyltransferase
MPGGLENTAPEIMSRLLELLASGNVLLMDGAMGTELQKQGLVDGECAELWNLSRPEPIRAIQAAYREAGATSLLTNTFQANPAALSKHGLGFRWEEINRAASSLARSTGGADAIVLADVGPGIGLALDESETYRRFVRSFTQADGLLLETQSSCADLERVLRGRDHADPADQLPVLFSVTYHRDAGGRIGTWEEKQPPEYYAERADQLGADALGVNCGRDMDLPAIIEVVRRYRRVTSLPLFARPNAGTPERVGKQWVYPRGPEQMAARLPELLEAGVSMLGGCCGTTPEYIAAFRARLEGRRCPE